VRLARPGGEGAAVNVGVCRSCGASILWALTDAGRHIPLDAEGEARFVLDVSEEPPRAVRTPTYVAHFATCPDADDWRRS